MGILKDWLQGIDYTLLAGTDEAEVTDVIFDSRKAAPDTVFLCMKGSRTDSHDFINDTIQKGCRTFVVERELSELSLADFTDLNIVRVDNARSALSVMSAARFDHPSRKMTMIGLTGTKGKTSTSYMIKTVLEECGHAVGVIGTNGCVIRGTHYETKNTTPDSYELNERFSEMLAAGCDTVVMECSSQGFKMERTRGIDFDYGLFLNLSPDHIGPLEHKDFAEYLWCKSRLLSQSKRVIVNADDPHTEEMIRKAAMPGDGSGPYAKTDSAENAACPAPWEKLCRFSLEDGTADLYATDLKYEMSAGFAGTSFHTKGILEDDFRLSIPGIFNVSNALSVLALAADMKLPVEAVKRALEKIHVDGRMEAVYKSDRFTVIVDYAHNEVSMVNLLDTLKAYRRGRLVVVFGCGGNRSKDRRIGMGAAAAHAADYCIFTADNSRFEKTEDIIADIEAAYLEAGGNMEAYVKIPDRREAIRYAMEHAKDGDMIAVIGKGHEDYQEENGVRKHFLDREEILKVAETLKA